MDAIPSPLGQPIPLYEALGVGPPPTEEVTRNIHLIVFQPSAEEQAAGFTFDVRLSAILVSPTPPTFSIYIDSATILAD